MSICLTQGYFKKILLIFEIKFRIGGAINVTL